MFGTGNTELAHTVAVTATGEAVVGGEYDGTNVLGPSTISGAGGFVAKLSTTGQWLWAASASGGRNIGVNHVAFDGAGQVLVAGVFPTTNAFFRPNLLQLTQPPGNGSDGFVGRLSPTGTWQWVAQVAGDLYQTAHTVLPRANGHTFVVGPMSSNPTVFGPVSLPLVGTQQNVFIATLVPAVTGVEEGSGMRADFAVFPNPARGIVRVALPVGGATAALELLDGPGRSVQTYPTAPGATTAELLLHGVAPGLYVVRLGARVRRLIRSSRLTSGSPHPAGGAAATITRVLPRNGPPPQAAGAGRF